MLHFKIILLTCCLLLSPLVYANERLYDAFIKEIQQQETRDSALQKVDQVLESGLTLEEIADVHHKTTVILKNAFQLEEAHKWAERFKQVLLTHHLPEYEAKYSLTYGDLMLNEGRFSDAISHLQISVTQFSELKMYRLLSHAHRFLGVAYTQNGDYKNGVKSYEMSIEIARTNELPELQILAITQLADTYSELSLPDKALELLQQSIAVLKSQKQENIVLLGQVYYNLGSAHQVIGDHEKSLAAYQTAYDYDIKAGSAVYSAYTLIRIGREQMMLTQYKNAEGSFKKAFTIFEENGHTRNQGWALSNLAEVKLKADEKVKAKEYVEQALELIDPVQSKVLYQETMTTYAHIVLPERADFFIKNMKQIIAQDEVQPGLKVIALLVLKDAYSAKGDFESALNYHLQYAESKVSQLKKEASQKALAYQMDTEYQKNQYELQSLKTQRDVELAEQRVEQIVTAAVVGVLVILLSAFLLLARNKRRALELEKQLLNKTLDLKQQLLADISHELRTPLTVLKLHIESLEHNLVENPKQSYKVLNRRLDTLNTLIKDIYELAQADTGSLNLALKRVNAKQAFIGLVEDIDDFVTDEGLKFNANIELPDELEIDIDVTRFAQVFNNLARNSVNYTDKPGEVSVDISYQSQQIQCVIEDSSPGVGDEALGRLFERLFRCDKSRSRDLGGSGLGLSICQKLVELHGGSIAVAHSELGGLKVSVIIPCE
ncbi:histidine kinase [Pseudoalteromonas sp. GCY]|uniref:tetratricopeptide repeat protein n=1 Tax=Pseudoalteromonas sp. GCY TaxID=2003316 RepID=UPI000BFF1627|nr:tetratricopeptide repeat protein [Pseudoalteromonas sp. GCY]PHI35661.1 histidine kinase [Pseudoalteromonas sp. GCY]QQQ67945.1 tetratricopeptide repeat protein [Pseudoalteromonas sp. GCY]